MAGPTSDSPRTDADSDDGFATADSAIEIYVSRLVGEDEATQEAGQASLVDCQNQIASTEQMIEQRRREIQQLERENEARRNKYVQLLGIQTAAWEKKREKLAKLQRRLQSNVCPNHSFP